MKGLDCPIDATMKGLDCPIDAAASRASSADATSLIADEATSTDDDEEGCCVEGGGGLTCVDASTAASEGNVWTPADALKIAAGMG